MSSSKLYINRREGSAISGWIGPTTFFVNGAIVSPKQKDLVGVNGVVHGLMIWIDKTSLKTSYEYTQTPDNPKVNSIFTINQRSSNYDGRFTLFVPNDAAIDRIDSSKLRDLQQDVQKLHEVIRAHYIKNAVLFYNLLLITIRDSLTPTKERCQYVNHIHITFYVNSGGVTSAITLGNITVNNGVIHVCDRLLGFIYNTVRQQISEDSPLVLNILY
ncbi:unnamed protein product [Mytilus edulis]|uniref:FAS1 domain-containing protein n=1 Tax=Mytilus edulis TaxID=6550 RepID=A0A8S3QK86_MYTED|nr:unnamed protein product [Mytilus edulis]